MRAVKSSFIGISFLLFVAMIASAQQETGHYPPGVEGLRGSTLPPPGTYLKWYNIAYNADTLKDA
ncbi:MAG: hypothetical protein WCJ09_25975, partial [Planctomycetota bacterium]